MEYHHQNWPTDLSPQNSPVYSYNEIKINADKAVIWEKLINAEGWSSWYSNCKNLKILSHDGPNLQPGTEFKWKTFGINVKTVIVEFEPNHKLAWRGKGLGAEGYHVWTIEDGGQGNFVITEEVQKGIIPWLMRFIFRRLLLKYHQIWLEGLANQVQSFNGT